MMPMTQAPGPAKPDARPTLALDPEHLLQRSLEVLPGLLTWATLIGLTILAFVRPFAAAIFLIFYDVYWLVRSIYIGVHLVASYRTLRRMRGVDWLKRLDQHAAAHASSGIAWREVLHVIVLPSYREPLAVLAQSIDGLAAARYPKDRLWVVVALEERAGGPVHELERMLHARYAKAFGRFLTTIHPDGIPGERKVKSANATYAGKIVQQLLDAEGIPYDQVLVSNLDADTVVSPDYFGSLTYAFSTTPDRLRCSYQPLPLYHNNIWDAPAFTRVISTNSTFWLLIECTRPERLVTYSSHAMPFAALVDVGLWDPAVVSEDSRIFWQCYIRYQGQYRTVPLYTTVSMDATRAPTLLRTFVNQYKQKRRWAWGIENFPYIARSFLRNPSIPRRERLRHIWIMLEAWHSWATAALILAVLGWIPILFGGAEFQQTVLAFNLPRITRTLLTVATAGLFLNMSLSLFLLPPAPPGTPKRKYAWMALQWVLVPVIAWTLGTVPVLDAVTRLMIGKYLGFWVTPKLREHEVQIAIAAPVLSGVARR